ncbi:hypothetical protein HFP89_10385 [Wenzhouxiangella sp. XN79A]|uniref:MAPEG family protein n=1 Tax=Wenzhouxiangella sp. XN79A TaxID=2724193 RepID=UPI00144AF35B|nr:MAPEG family protein [Wenzhouxiangella sp. XN79A]NKI35572.1 hypothetical protein [Wenzhouxiangella sp. XN79A]
MTPEASIVLAAAALVFSTFAVAARMYIMRVREMKDRRIHPQAVALSADRSARLTDTRASDNYNHLFELPVLFYALCAIALALDHVPAWLALGAWLFVASRVVHSVIQCTSNRVMHRLVAFAFGLVVLFGVWIGFVWTWLAR